MENVRLIVTFIDYNIVDNYIVDLENFRYPNSLDAFGVDAYIVSVYPANHKFYFSYSSDRAYWMDKFNKTRRNRLGNKLQKGFSSN